MKLKLKLYTLVLVEDGTVKTVTRTSEREMDLVKAEVVRERLSDFPSVSATLMDRELSKGHVTAMWMSFVQLHPKVGAITNPFMATVTEEVIEVDAPEIVAAANPEEKVWLDAWHILTSNGLVTSPSLAVEWADACLSGFRKQFRK